MKRHEKIWTMDERQRMSELLTDTDCYLPTPEDIRIQTSKIREGWSEYEREKRNAYKQISAAVIRGQLLRVNGREVDEG